MCLIHNRVVILEMNWNFVDKKTGMNFIKGSSLKNEKIRCFVDVIQDREVVKTFEVDITNTRTLKSSSQEENDEGRWANIIEIDANEISGEVDILFRDLVYLSGKYELTGIIFKVKVKVGVTVSRQEATQKSAGELTVFEVVNV